MAGTRPIFIIVEVTAFSVSTARIAGRFGGYSRRTEVRSVISHRIILIGKVPRPFALFVILSARVDDLIEHAMQPMEAVSKAIFFRMLPLAIHRVADCPLVAVKNIFDNGFFGFRTLAFLTNFLRIDSLCCTDGRCGCTEPRPCRGHTMRTYSGRPSSSMRFSTPAATATSVACRPSVCERNPSPMTRFQREMSASTKARQL